MQGLVQNHQISKNSFLSTQARARLRRTPTMAINVGALVGSFAAQTVVVFASHAAPAEIQFKRGDAIDAGSSL